MFVTIAAFSVGCYHIYNQQSIAMAGETHIALPDFEHTNNQQFIDNVSAVYMSSRPDMASQVMASYDCNIVKRNLKNKG